jgi:hypothetical protein
MEIRDMPGPERSKARLPPRWFIRLAWITTHRRLYRWTGGRVGLWRPKPGSWGTLRLTTIVDGARQVTGRAAQGGERERLWGRWRQIDKNLDAYAARRSRQTAVVVLEPRRH